MSTTDTDVFMSSPPRPASLDPVLISSSSPNLPSLDDIFTKNPKKTSFSTAIPPAPVATNAGISFSTAAALLRDAPEIDIETEQITDSPPRKAKDNRGRKKIVAPGPVSKGGTEIPAPIVIDSPSPKDKPWHKFKSNKPISQDKQVSVLGIDENKPKTKRPGRAKTGTVSRHFTPTTEEEIPSRNKGKGKADINCGTPQQKDLGATTSSEPALARRIDWTPPRTTGPTVFDSDPDTRELYSSVDKAAVSKDVFPSLFDTYGRADTIQQGGGSGQQSQLEVLKKRKHIELVSTTNNEGRQPKGVSAPKATTVKKKTRTLTELATSRYILPPQPELDIVGPSTEESLLNYFDEDGALKGLVEHQATVMSMKKEKAKPEKETAKSKRKKKAGTENNPILLSPNSALKQSSNQDFVFGTSSQLVREDSPTTLRELQMAIRASNQIDSDPFAEPDSQGLWHASARDMDGDLMEIEVLDPEMSPVVVRKSVEENTSISDTFVDIEDILTSPANASMTSTTVRFDQDASRSIQSQVNKPAQPLESNHTELANSAPAAPRPNYELLTDAQLARQITSYGFKPVKKRQTMIALLDQCWASKNQGYSSIHANTITTSAQAPSPKKTKPVDSAASANPTKPRGRSKKNVDAGGPSTESAKPPKAPSPMKIQRTPPKRSRANTIEIADSETEGSTSPSPKSSPDRIFSSPPPLDLSLLDEEGDNTLMLSLDDEQTRLFRHITKAVTSVPRSEDPLKPSWHEKMLMFDPVVLEDLTAWLNDGQLTRIGYHGQVSTHEVKKWCESKSVICIWRQTSRGTERKRF